MTLRGGEKILLPFPKGWSRVVAARRHLTEGAAGKTTLHRPITRREASIRRSQCGNSEAIVGEMGGSTTKMWSFELLFKIIGFHSIYTIHSSTQRKIPTISLPYTLQWTARCCIMATIYYTDHFKLGGEARPNENISQEQRSLFEGGRRARLRNPFQQ